MTDTTTDTGETTARAPMPLDVLARQVFDDSSDYDDGVGGWCTASFDGSTGVLTVKYKRDDDMDEELIADEPDYQHGSTEYRFALLPPGHIVVPAPWCAYPGGDTNAARCRQVADRIEGNTLPGSNSRDMAARLLRDAAAAIERMGVVLDVDPVTGVPTGGSR